MRRMTR